MTTAQLYIIHDTVANHVLGVPIIGRHVAHGIRQFQDIAEDKGTIVNQHPNDFQLLHVGQIDMDTGGIVAQPPTFVIRASDFTDKNLKLAN